ncbi:DUF6471 domain-containing protein [Sphingobium sp. EM0848]|uniref:DUF6471 domain-containing protein n=1 Tax=Sphingobium sp. EM0848 TaxID=2743473 RepID=UPI003510CC2E
MGGAVGPSAAEGQADGEIRPGHGGRRISAPHAIEIEAWRRECRSTRRPAPGAGVSDKEPGERLSVRGLPESEGFITVKINRGAFPAWFLITSLEAIGATSLRLSDS